MKTILALLLLTACAQAQSIHDMERQKQRVRITVQEVLPQGVVCFASLLVRNKLGREVPGSPLIPYENGEPKNELRANGSIAIVTSSSPRYILVLDLDFQPVKTGEERDLWLYPAAAKRGDMHSYFAHSANAVLDVSGGFKRTINAARLESLSFEASLVVQGDKILMQRKGARPPQWRGVDPFMPVEEIQLMGSSRPAAGRLYPTAKFDTFALSVLDALKTFQ